MIPTDLYRDQQGLELAERAGLSHVVNHGSNFSWKKCLNLMSIFGVQPCLKHDWLR